MYTTSWCGYCVRLKQGLARAGVDFAEVNIEQDENAADRVMQVNGGNQTVPTLEFADGSALTNPTVAQVQEKLAALV
jgi:mycoredoxin